MDYVCTANAFLEFLAKPLKRFYRIILAGLYLDRKDLEPELAVAGDEEVGLDVVAVLFLAVMDDEAFVFVLCKFLHSVDFPTRLAPSISAAEVPLLSFFQSRSFS